jgi:hypothetical protein
MSDFSSLLIVSHWFFTWIALGDVDLPYSLMLARKTNAVEEETKWAMWMYDQRNQSIHMTDGVIEMSVSAGLQKISVAMKTSERKRRR